jgi:Zn-dependent M28 family amino/carboxypeptidase
MTFRKAAIGLPVVVTVMVASLYSAFAQERTDYNLIHQIKQEAFEHSQVMDHLEALTDRYGPRLTASPEFDEAAAWVLEKMKSWGLSNVHKESWGPFGRSWSLKRYSVEMIEPRYSLLNAMPLAWSEPTKPVTGEPVMAPFNATASNQKKTEEDFEKYKQQWHGKLRGRIVLFNRPRNTTADAEARPAFTRYTDPELANLAKTPDATPKVDIRMEDLKIPEDPQEAQRYMASLPADIRTALNDRAREATERRDRFFVDEGAAAIFVEDARAHDGLVFAEAAGTRKASEHMSVPKFRLTEEHYNRIARLLEKKEPVKLQIELDATVGDRDVNAANLVGELPGGAKKDEIVMIGAHFDSWHGGTGATDNAAGSAVMLEVMRVLSTLHMNLDRTVRIALWSGEEQGLLGSKAYVKEHFGNPETMAITGEHAKLAAYFNLDNGSGRIRGVYLQDNDAARPFFDRALIGPFRDLGVTTISLRNTGGTDHLSFDDVGLPGFQFIQDPMDYNSVTHHSSMDTFDHIVAADMVQASAIIAAVVAQEANAPEMMPRKPLPVIRKNAYREPSAAGSGH